MIDDRMAEILRSKSEAERLAIAHGMWSFARGMICSILQSEHADWTVDQVHQEAARRLSHGAV
jgi:hypothetical protein